MPGHDGCRARRDRAPRRRAGGPGGPVPAARAAGRQHVGHAGGDAADLERGGGSPMMYLLFICSDGEPFEAAPEELDATAWVEEMTRRGVRSFGDQLAPTDRATTVRVRDGSMLLTDGPFAETKEQIVGIDVIECADLDEALEVAAK